MDLQLGITNGSVGMGNSRQAAGKVTLLQSEPVDTAIDCSSVGGLIHPRLGIDVHVMRKHVGQLIILLANKLLAVGGGGETRGEVERNTGSGSVGHTGHGSGTNASCAKASEKGSAMSGSWGGGHG